MQILEKGYNNKSLQQMYILRLSFPAEEIEAWIKRENPGLNDIKVYLVFFVCFLLVCWFFLISFFFNFKMVLDFRKISKIIEFLCTLVYILYYYSIFVMVKESILKHYR